MQHYRAFISYSHADARWAAWLQRSLERYRVPRRLRVAGATAHERLRPVFRDREELASSDDLSQSIRDALSASEALLLVCSPTAAASRWVNEEIRTFRSVTPEGRIFCLMVDGSADPGAADCAFPPALLTDADGHPLPEPLAADPRSEADGKRGALLKIAAGLLGVGIDALRQRDQQRRLRVMGAVTGGALIVAVCTILLAVVAMQARNESELRRVQAGDLIEFMLVDLRTQLEPIGQLSILERVGDKAMDYFSALGDYGTRGEVFSRVMALRQIGEVRFNQGQLEPAHAAFSESRDLAASLLAAEPNDNHLRFELGQSEFWVGYVAWERIDLEGAETAFRAYSDISDELYRREPDNPDYLMERMYAAVNLAGLTLERGRQDQAIRYISDAVDIGRTLVAQQPGRTDFRLELARALSWQGSVLSNAGDLKGAVAAFREGHEILAPLHAAGEDANHSSEFGDMILLLADALAMTGEVDAALQRFQSAQDVYGPLVRSDATNALWLEGLSRAFQGSGEMSLVQKHRAPARALLDRAVSGFDALVAADPANQVFRLRLARAVAEAAWAAAIGGDSTAARAQAQRALSLLDGPAEPGTLPATARIRVVTTLDRCGAVFEAVGEPERARQAWNAALALLVNEPGSSLIEQALHARVMYRVGRGDEVRELPAQLRAAGLDDARFLPAAAEPPDN